MSVYSMTGYATATAAALAAPGQGPAAAASVTVDIRSVNGRFLDLSLRLPDELRALEPPLRELVSAQVRRGKVELRVSTSREAADGPQAPSPDLVQRLLHVEGMVRNWMPQAASLSVNEVLHWARSGGPSLALDEPTLEAARQAVAGLREARAREGQRLADTLLERVARLRALADQAEPLLPQVVRRQQERFIERWNEALATAGAGATLSAQATQERALNEAAAFAIRIDVAEELARLRSHLSEIERLLRAGGELGKRLDFLIQELQREANTLGSKSAALELTNISVEMKVAVEQLREQVQNIE